MKYVLFAHFVVFLFANSDIWNYQELSLSIFVLLQAPDNISGLFLSVSHNITNHWNLKFVLFSYLKDQLR